MWVAGARTGVDNNAALTRNACCTGQCILEVDPNTYDHEARCKLAPIGGMYCPHVARIRAQSSDARIKDKLHSVATVQALGRLRDDRRNHTRHEPGQTLEHGDCDPALARSGRHFQANEAAADYHKRQAERATVLEAGGDGASIFQRS